MEIGGGDGYTTMYLMPPNCTLKNCKLYVTYFLPQKKQNEDSIKRSLRAKYKESGGTMKVLLRGRKKYS